MRGEGWWSPPPPPPTAPPIIRGLVYEGYEWLVEVMDVVASKASRRHDIDGALGSSEFRGEDKSTFFCDDEEEAVEVEERDEEPGTS